MIPKTIHYCWFGRGEKSAKEKKCIESWRKFCPDYEIIEWNEDNFDIDRSPYTRWCYEQKKWAFLSDCARLAIVCEQGGIYFDTDVEVVRSLDGLLSLPAFYGYESPSHVNTGQGFGAEAHHPTVERMLMEYDSIKPLADGSFPLCICPELNTRALVSLGFSPDGTEKEVAGARILPVDFLNPLDDPTGRMNITDNTYSIHWYAKSWLSRKDILRSRITRPFHRVFGVDCFEKIKRHTK